MPVCFCEDVCLKENSKGVLVSRDVKDRHTKAAARKSTSARVRGRARSRPGAGLSQRTKTAANRKHLPNPPPSPRRYRSEIDASDDAALAASIATEEANLMDVFDPQEFDDWLGSQVNDGGNAQAGPSGSVRTPPPSPGHVPMSISPARAKSPKDISMSDPLATAPNMTATQTRSHSKPTVSESGEDALDVSTDLREPSSPNLQSLYHPASSQLRTTVTAPDSTDEDAVPSLDQQSDDGEDDDNDEGAPERFFGAVDLAAENWIDPNTLEGLIGQQAQSLSEEAPGADDFATNERPLPASRRDPAASQGEGGGATEQPSITHTFELPPARPDPTDIYAESHGKWFVRIIILTVAFLHFTFHLPFAACNVVLFMCWGVLRGLDQLPSDDDMPTTLPTVIKRLSLDDRFYIVPRCDECHHLFIEQVDDPEETSCPQCGAQVFRLKKTLVSDASNLLLRRQKKKKRSEALVPNSVVPFRPVSELIAEALQQDGMADKLDAWHRRDRSDPDVLHDMMDGRIWKELKDHSGGLFFGPNAVKEELRIGLTINLDWFNMSRNQNSPSHDVGPISICIANLDSAERYQTKNLLVPFILPGPKEQTAEELQQYLKVIVDDLIPLYNDGLDVPAMNGRKVRVAVVAVICDHPAMCKFCGLADKNHNNVPCTRCHISKANLKSKEGLQDGFAARDGAEIKARAAEWQSLPTAAQRDAHFKEHGVRWFEFSRLSYFDPVRMLVIDPMHNLLLGIVKHQWYATWITKEKALRANTKTSARELQDIHDLLKKAEFPSWLGRLPAQIGIPAGGSLSADEWKTLAVAFGPLALPIVWDDWMEAAHSEIYDALVKADDARAAAKEKYEKQHEKYVDAVHIRRILRDTRLRKRAQAKEANPDEPESELEAEDDEPRPPKPLPPSPSEPSSESPRMKDEDMPNFLRLSFALSLLLARSISRDDLDTAYTALTTYLVEFRKIYGEDALMPNFHFASHIREQVLDYGPVYGFWAFLQERLNFTLKHFKTNNHGGGEMEVTLMRSFDASTRLRHLLHAAVTMPDEDGELESEGEGGQQWVKAIARRLMADSTIVRGTVEITAVSGNQLDAQQHERPFVLGPSRLDHLTPEMHGHLVNHFNRRSNSGTTSDGANLIYPDYDDSAPSGALTLGARVQVSDYLILDGRRITSLGSARIKNAGSSLVLVKNPSDGRRAVGEVHLICVPLDRRVRQEPVLCVRWLKRTLKSPTKDDIWAEHRDRLRIDVWEFNHYEDDAAKCPSPFVSWSDIISQAGRLTVREEAGSINQLWLTIAVGQHGTPL